MKHAASALALQSSDATPVWPRAVSQARRPRALATIERADTEACALATPIGIDEEASGVRESGVGLVSRLGPYRLLKMIGSGAMGNVYEAEHQLLGRRVAIKTLRRELTGNRSFEERMFAEARASDMVGDEHIAKVFDLAHDPNGLTWFAMELLEGENLAALCDRREIGVARALELARQVCEALIPVHEAGIVHRDIKPDNVFVVDHDGHDFVKLLDFGIARLPAADNAPARGPEVVIGTPPYMAPEQVYGGEVDQRSDLYAVGALLFELLTGRQLFERANMTELLGAIVLAQPPVPSEHATLPANVRAAIDRVIARCLAKDRERRPASARDLAGELVEISFHLESGEPLELVPAPIAAEIVTEPIERAIEADDVVTASVEPSDVELPAEKAVSAMSHAARKRRAVAWVALTAAAVTWLAPASSLLHVQPAMVNASSWLSALVASASWSRFVRSSSLQ